MLTWALSIVISSFRVEAFKPGGGSHEIIGFAGASWGSGASGLFGLEGGSTLASAVLSGAATLSFDEALELLDVPSDDDDDESGD